MSTYRDDSPPESCSKEDMLKHPCSEGFVKSCGLEIETILRIAALYVVRHPNDRSIQILLLIRLFTYNSTDHKEEKKSLNTQ